MTLEEDGRTQGGTEGIACYTEIGTAMYEHEINQSKGTSRAHNPTSLSLWNCEKLTVCSLHDPVGPVLWHPQQYTQFPGTHLSDLAGLLTLHLR